MFNYKSVAVAALVVCSMLAVPVAPVAAQSQTDSCTVDVDGMQTVVDAYNDNRGELPGPVRSQLAGERVNVVVTSPDGDVEYSAVTDSTAAVTQFSEGLVDDPTIRVETDESTVCEALDSQNPVAAAVDAYRNGDITVDGVGPVKSVTFGAVKALFDLGNALGLF
ncbi:hypothetical protein [Halobaculum lipolyticum]|uniref:Uncharacterized protein n=1 Tax=Halobaculum lipolyticum TaxID=3032001 RepID=A0ABD5WGJ5_9EURY|nr:hypothetical protein [Halobaculum sp. DT31]